MVWATVIWVLPGYPQIARVRHLIRGYHHHPPHRRLCPLYPSRNPRSRPWTHTSSPPPSRLSPSRRGPSHQARHPWVSAWVPSRTHSGWASSSHARRRLSAGRARACACGCSPCPPGRHSPGAKGPRQSRSRSRPTRSWKSQTRTRRSTRPRP